MQQVFANLEICFQAGYCSSSFLPAESHWFPTSVTGICQQRKCMAEPDRTCALLWWGDAVFFICVKILFNCLDRFEQHRMILHIYLTCSEDCTVCFSKIGKSIKSAIFEDVRNFSNNRSWVYFWVTVKMSFWSDKYTDERTSNKRVTFYFI